MGRRKKEEPNFHRNCIANTARQLFLEKGISSTTMDDIAKTAKYSKATIYVYFKNKEEIIGTLTLGSMTLLHNKISLGIASSDKTIERYKAICNELIAYQQEFPLYFELVLEEINIDFDASSALPVEQEIFKVGELIAAEIAAFLEKGISDNVLREDLSIPQTVFLFWASLSGIIKMAEKKKQYIEKIVGITKQQFLNDSFDTLFRSIRKNGGTTI